MPITNEKKEGKTKRSRREADATRKILETLLKYGELNARELVKKSGLSSRTVYKALSLMRLPIKKQLAKEKKDRGRPCTVYSIDKEAPLLQEYARRFEKFDDMGFFAFSEFQAGKKEELLDSYKFYAGWVPLVLMNSVIEELKRFNKEPTERNRRRVEEEKKNTIKKFERFIDVYTKCVIDSMRNRGGDILKSS